ncbi:hypothetical protein DVH24_036465 [Malus domestica]|uniref:Glucose-6-phosphate dehydrogenase C-terminal domain-containing protein n=1 Tax=Malus domestica TaxID=3750 RepID=A0A498IIX4_MALDO|nr:hypothetical protein DVH24_036465 [Malus domestica]
MDLDNRDFSFGDDTDVNVNHLFLRSNELAAAWNVLTPVLNEIDKKNIATELYELGGRGPVGAYHLLGKTWGSLGRGLAT